VCSSDLAEAGARSAGYIALRLSGSCQDVFLARLREQMPQRAERIEHRIRDIRGGRLNETAFGCRMTGQGVYWDSIRRLFAVSVGKFGLDRLRPPEALKKHDDPRGRDDQLTFDFDRRTLAASSSPESPIPAAIEPG